jgi:hypothetical protein
VRVTEAERQQLHQQVAQLHQFREQRLQQEREGARARAAGGAAASRPRPMNLPHSPIAARPAPRPAGSHTNVARRSEAERQPVRGGSLGHEAHPAAGAAGPHRMGSERTRAGAENASHRSAQNPEWARPQTRPEASRPQTRPETSRPQSWPETFRPSSRLPSRQPSSSRTHSRPTTEEERRRTSP